MRIIIIAHLTTSIFSVSAVHLLIATHMICFNSFSQNLKFLRQKKKYKLIQTKYHETILYLAKQDKAFAGASRLTNDL